jgi:hypothetical protein
VKPRAGSADSGTPADQAGGSGAIPTSALQVRQVSRQVGRTFIRQHHYLHSTPAGARLILGVFDNGEALARLIGVVWIGRPWARQEDQVHTVEINRLCLLDVTERNAESRVIRIARQYVRRLLPDVCRIIAYADPSVGHEGVIYKASGFRYVGDTTGTGGACRPDTVRPGCNVLAISQKRKYEYLLNCSRRTQQRAAAEMATGKGA